MKKLSFVLAIVAALAVSLDTASARGVAVAVVGHVNHVGFVGFGHNTFVAHSFGFSAPFFARTTAYASFTPFALTPTVPVFQASYALPTVAYAPAVTYAPAVAVAAPAECAPTVQAAAVVNNYSAPIAVAAPAPVVSAFFGVNSYGVGVHRFGVGFGAPVARVDKVAVVAPRSVTVTRTFTGPLGLFTRTRVVTRR